MFEGSGDVGSLSLGFEVDDFPDDAQDVAAPLLGGDEPLDAVTEKEGADLVVVLPGREGEDGGEFRGELPLCRPPAADGARRGDVDEEHRGQLPLLLKDLDVGGPHPGGHVPVDGANLVSMLISPVLAEGHATALERAVVFTGKDLVAQAAGTQFHPPDAPDQLCGFHAQGTWT